jgi:hypothetical protein
MFLVERVDHGVQHDAIPQEPLTNLLRFSLLQHFGERLKPIPQTLRRLVFIDEIAE